MIFFMKYTSLSSFEKHLLEAAPAFYSNLYVVLIKDSFLRQTVAHKIKRSLLPDSLSEAGHVIKSDKESYQLFNGTEQEAHVLLQELYTYSLLTKKRVLLVQNFDLLPKDMADKIVAYSLNPMPHTFLILCGAVLNSNTNFYKQLEKIGTCLVLPEEKPWEKEKSMQAWVMNHIQDKHKKMSVETCQFLIKQVGTDTACLYQEVEKLLCFIDTRQEITKEDIIALCPIENLETIWQLSEAIFNKDTRSALRISKNLAEEGTHFLTFLRQLRSQIFQGFQVASILAQGGNDLEIVQEFPYMKGRILEKNKQQALHYGMEKCRQALLYLDNTERKAKNSQIDAEILNEMLIIHLTS